MKSREDIQAYLIRSGLPYQEVDAETWLVRVETGVDAVVVHIHDPVVIVRADVGPVPAKDRETFFADLLRRNAAELVHCSYGISDDKVVLSGAMPLENLDYNEFISTLDDMAIALDRTAGDAAQKA
ncbi:MAG: hypothetical protein HY905_22715 [Deltaproteobacteria bacterium]|nr:hypothetical protein [Deltaproteobacteria bacterium]